ncbi:MAG: hypothetical protein RML48_04865 [Candidatus Bipolaricaulota bacterium]|nr:hypothetical protein [Candidatus Bipolaricaulota bacterium]
MAKRKNSKGTVPAVVDGQLERLAQEGKLSEADVAILNEVAANRKAILKLGALALDHERRISNLEDALADLVGDEAEPIDIKAEREDDED